LNIILFIITTVKTTSPTFNYLCKEVILS
jgi:hypothetical protein